LWPGCNDPNQNFPSQASPAGIFWILFIPLVFGSFETGNFFLPRVLRFCNQLRHADIVVTLMKTQKRRFPVMFVRAAVVIGGILASNASGQVPEGAGAKTISLGIVSEINQKQIEAHYGDFVRYVARRLSSEGKVVIAPTLPQLAKLLEQGQVDFYMDSPYPTYVINNVQGAGKLVLRRWQRGKPEYQSLIFTKRNSEVRRLQDLRGKIIVFEDPDSSSGHFIPKFFLLRNGFKLADKTRGEPKVSPGEIGFIFAYSQTKLLDLVLSKQAAAGAFSDDDHANLDGKRKSEVNVLAETERLPRHLVSVRKDLASSLAARLTDILISMHENDEGRKILQKTGETTKFDLPPGGEEGMRRRLLETFYSVDRK
jgi:phosphonate transport system substrate-binding protein